MCYKVKNKLLENINGTIYKINQYLKYKKFSLMIRIKDIINCCRYGMYAKKINKKII